jgi:hypothetical protein
MKVLWARVRLFLAAKTFSAFGGWTVSGLFPPLTVVKRWSILRVFWYLSYDRWSAEAFVLLGVKGQPTDGRMDHAIVAAGYDPGNLNADIGLTFLIGVMWRVLTWIALKRSQPRTEF